MTLSLDSITHSTIFVTHFVRSPVFVMSTALYIAACAYLKFYRKKKVKQSDFKSKNKEILFSRQFILGHRFEQSHSFVTLPKKRKRKKKEFIYTVQNKNDSEK